MKLASRPPWPVWFLFALQLVLGIGACYGGGALVLDPTGGLVGLSADLMVLEWFPDYFVPGLILLLVLGVCPLIIAFALIRRWNWRAGEALSPYKSLHWSWTFSLYTGFAILIWMAVEAYIMQQMADIQLLYITLGLAILIVTLLPAVIRFYYIPPVPSPENNISS